MILLSVQTVSVSSAETSNFQGELKALEGALRGRDQVVQAMRKRDFVEIAHQSLDNAIRELAEDLRVRQDETMALELIASWEKNQFKIFSKDFNKDLGDHAPLFDWLEDFLIKMAAKYGDIILKLPLVQDIRTLNFAIPVAFAPKGAWRLHMDSINQADRIEYRKHFIPFANITTYYVSYYGCLYVVREQGLDDNFKKLCKKAAEKLKFVMGRHIAPQVSDWLYTTTNRGLTIQDSQLVYRTPAELQAGI